ncbi:hypothetical protein D3C75_1195650 [compost metagenome]
MEEAVAGDAGVVHQSVDGPQLGLDRLNRAGAVVKRADIALDDHDTQLASGRRRRLVIAGIAGGDGHAVFAQSLDDRLADASRATRNQRHSRHDAFPCP